MLDGGRSQLVGIHLVTVGVSLDDRRRRQRFFLHGGFFSRRLFLNRRFIRYFGCF